MFALDAAHVAHDAGKHKENDPSRLPVRPVATICRLLSRQVHSAALLG
jgi:hypothetical protein